MGPVRRVPARPALISALTAAPSLHKAACREGPEPGQPDGRQPGRAP